MATNSAARVGDGRLEGGATRQRLTAPEAIDVAIADKSPLILAGLDKLLSEDRRFQLVLKVTDGEEFLEAARRLWSVSLF